MISKNLFSVGDLLLAYTTGIMSAWIAGEYLYDMLLGVL